MYFSTRATVTVEIYMATVAPLFIILFISCSLPFFSLFSVLNKHSNFSSPHLLLFPQMHTNTNTPTHKHIHTKNSTQRYTCSKKKKKKDRSSELVGLAWSELVGMDLAWSELGRSVLVDRSCGSVQLWIGVVDRSCGSVLVTEAVERSCGSEFLTERERDGWIGASDRSLWPRGRELGWSVLLIGVCDQEGERWVWTTERER